MGPTNLDQQEGVWRGKPFVNGSRAAGECVIKTLSLLNKEIEACQGGRLAEIFPISGSPLGWFLFPGCPSTPALLPKSLMKGHLSLCQLPKGHLFHKAWCLPAAFTRAKVLSSGLPHLPLCLESHSPPPSFSPS